MKDIAPEASSVDYGTSHNPAMHTVSVLRRARFQMTSSDIAAASPPPIHSRPRAGSSLEEFAPARQGASSRFLMVKVRRMHRRYSHSAPGPHPPQIVSSAA
ncbi:MAG: hypothetical protein ACLUHE_13550 [Christensenellales bacterium]